MPPKKLPRTAQEQKQQTPSQSASNVKGRTSQPTSSKRPVPDHEVKKASSLNAQFALEATKKAYELRQAAYGAGDPNAREEILAKAINKEIEAESFGKAAKYTRSGAFQGLAAGAGLGVQPGVTLGKLTGALVGGLLSSVGAVLGGGVGAAYGAMSGPFWDLGQIASQGVRSIVGDFPNWEATSSQKKALEKMVLGAQRTKKPSQEELEEMRDDNGGATQADYEQFHDDLTSWIPSMPSMPSMPSLSSIPGLGGGFGRSKPAPPRGRTTVATKPSQTQTSGGSAKPSAASTNARQNGEGPATARSRVPSKPRNVAEANSESIKRPTEPQAPNKQQASSGKASGQQSHTSFMPQTSSTPKSTSPKPQSQHASSQNTPKTDDATTKPSPKKLESRSTSTTTTSQPAAKRKPPKLQPRPQSTTKA